jgi:spectinomycin phosphotransferase
MQPSFYQQIKTFIETHYPITVDSISPLLLGADINASVFLVKAHNETNYFLKISQKNPDYSGALLTFLYESGIRQIIPPIKSPDGNPIQKMDNRSFTLYPFIQGKNGFEQELTSTQWIGLGKTLKQIHELTIPASIKDLLRQETFSSASRETVRSLLFSYLDTMTVNDDFAAEFLGTVKAKKEVILRLLDRTDYLAHALKDQPHHFVLCHSDIHAGNVLMGESEALYIIDWDDAILAPKERDLMFIGGGVGNVWNKASEVTSFYQGYGNGSINETLLAYYRCARIIEDIEDYSRQFLDPHIQCKDGSTAYHHFVSQFDPGGVVEIALNTETGCTL